MPAPIDVTVWQSLWTIAKNKSLEFKPKLSESLLDFKIGYIGTALLAICFLSLGALVLYGTGEELSSKGVIIAFIGLLREKFIGFIAAMMAFAVCVYFPLFYTFRESMSFDVVLVAIFLWAVPSLLGIIGLWTNRDKYKS